MLTAQESSGPVGAVPDENVSGVVLGEAFLTLKRAVPLGCPSSPNLRGA